MQCVSQTTLPLHKRINLHRKAKYGCKYVIKHFKDVCIGASFPVQISEVFPGTGYNNKLCPAKCETRLDREDYWIETLQTFHPCGYRNILVQ